MRTGHGSGYWEMGQHDQRKLMNFVCPFRGHGVEPGSATLPREGDIRTRSPTPSSIVPIPEDRGGVYVWHRTMDRNSVEVAVGERA